MKILCVGFNKTEVLKRMGKREDENLSFKEPEQLTETFDFGPYGAVLIENHIGHNIRTKVTTLINNRERPLGKGTHPKRRDATNITIIAINSETELLEKCVELLPLQKVSVRTHSRKILRGSR